jgi:hypothetical protein
MLLALLQRTPALRIVAGAGDYVLASPAGQWLRGVLTAAALGAMHSRAGATTFVQNPGNPVTGTVGSQLAVVFTYVGTPSSPARFSVTGGSLPPGLSFIPAPSSGGIINSGEPGIAGVPTQAGSFSIMVQGFNAEGLTNNAQQEIRFEIAGGSTNTPPAISTQPQNQSVAPGAAVTFAVAATGQPAPTFQWRKNGANIAGATGATLSLTNIQAADAGTYSVVVTNSAGSVTSNNATLTVNTTSAPPTITLQPASQTMASGHTAVFNVGATGATGFQWRRGGTNIVGATSATLVIANVSAAAAGTYTVVVSGATGAPANSTPATLSVVNDTNFGRLINLSILTDIPAAGDKFTLGYVVGGTGTSGNKPLVIRAAGPSLGALGVPGTVADPKMEFFTGTVKSGDNDNWGGSANLTAAMAAVGAFGYTGGTSLDAAAAVSVPSSSNSVEVSAVGSGTGTVIAEIYDATPSSAFTPATPRLVNVSVLKHLGTGLTMGFVVGGNTSKSVLVRAVGPTLAGFGVGGTVADPQLILRGPGGVSFGANNDWGDAVALGNAATAVGGFGLAAGSKDAALLVTLPPNSYTVEVTGVANTTGSALIEVYEVP